MPSPHFTVDNFVGCIVSGSIRETENPLKPASDVNKVLGTGFVVNPEKGIILTCNHVLPEEDRNSDYQFAFYTLDKNQNIRVFLIDTKSAIQWLDNDLIALKLHNPADLKTSELSIVPLSLATQVTAVGLPLNHFESKQGNNSIIIRAITGFVVSVYKNEYELDKPFIVTMSGSPIFFNGKIVGIVYKNRQYATEQYQIESEEISSNGVVVKKEVFEYKEVSKFGVFYKASSWHQWLQDVSKS